jgi:hypothetical protein
LKPTRIILVGLPRMLVGIVKTLVAAEPDLVVVAEVPDYGTARDTVEQGRADVVIAGFESFTAEYVACLLSEHPALRFLAISADGGDSVLYQLRPHAEVLGEISPQSLLSSIRENPQYSPLAAHAVIESER